MLLANFVLTPALAYVIKAVIPRLSGYGIGLILSVHSRWCAFPACWQVAKGSRFQRGDHGAVDDRDGHLRAWYCLCCCRVWTANLLDIAFLVGGVDVNPVSHRSFINNRYGGLASNLHQPWLRLQHGLDAGRGFAGVKLALTAVNHWERRDPGCFAADLRRISDWLVSTGMSRLAACAWSRYWATKHRSCASSGWWKFQRSGCWWCVWFGAPLMLVSLMITAGERWASVRILTIICRRLEGDFFK